MVLGQTPLLFVAVTMCVTMNNLPKYVTSERDKKRAFLSWVLVKNLSQSVNCQGHSKAFRLPTGRESAEGLLTLANFTSERSWEDRSFLTPNSSMYCCTQITFVIARSVKSQRTHLQLHFGVRKKGVSFQTCGCKALSSGAVWIHNNYWRRLYTTLITLIWCRLKTEH